MNRKIANGVATVAVLLSTAALAACSTVASPSSPSSPSSTSSTNLTIAGVYGGTSDPFWTTLVCGAQAEAKSEGVTFKAFTSTNQDTSSFSTSFQSAQLIHPNGIIISPNNANQFLSQYQESMAKGVPVVTLAGTTPAAQLNVVGTDPDTKPFLSDALKVIPQGSGTMAVLGGISGLAPLERRYVPFVDAVKKARPDYTALPTEYTFFDVNKATSYVSSIILAHPDLKLIVAASGPEGQGAAAALQQSGKAGKITLIAFDAVPPEIQALKAGVITALIAQSPTQIGANQVKTLTDYLKKHGTTGKVPASSEEVDSEQRFLTKANVDDKANADWIYKTSCS